MNKDLILVTGGAGFIGSAFVRYMSSKTRILVLDLMTYAGDMRRLGEVPPEQMSFIRGDICDEALVSHILNTYRPKAIVHLAAESHVDRSIDGPQAFMKTNVEGTMNLLNCATNYWRSLHEGDRDQFRFLHVSTDEVYGSLTFDEHPFCEDSPYLPNSPYAASKAASDHFVRAWHKTFGLPTLITHCSNNYGPWQFPEKLIPLMITKSLQSKPLPVYGDGSNIRDWVHVNDHVAALELVLDRAIPGSVYSVGGNYEISNLNLIKLMCATLDRYAPRLDGLSYQEEIIFVQDRPGHDVRYAINTTKIKSELGWTPSVNFSEGINQTIQWYLNAQDWIRDISNLSTYQQERLGIGVVRSNQS